MIDPIAIQPLEPLADPLIYGAAALFSFVLGLLFGSFFNVAIYRTPLGLSVRNPKRSFCFRCGSPVAAMDNIPVLSWLLLRGRCRSCAAAFSFRYAAIELFTGLLFLAVFLSVIPFGGEPRIALLWYWAFTGLLVVGTFTDFDHWIIPDGITVWGAVAGLPAAVLIGLVDGNSLLTDAGPFPAVRHMERLDILEVFRAIFGSGADFPTQWWEAPANAVIGLLLGPAILFTVGEMGRLLLRKEAMGFGDVKLFALIGVTLGPLNTVLVLFMASIFGTISGLLAIIASWFRQASVPALEAGRSHAPSGEAAPEGSTAAMLAALVSRDADQKPGRTFHHLPFGPWIALAGMVMLLFHDSIRAALAGYLVP